ncbi:MAG: hypothetical protein KAS32_20600 [Candidatus Peribacteraceae bacterium]|nr:hypothetical protein [Candidatus Peribacteraceae bacterium]
MSREIKIIETSTLTQIIHQFGTRVKTIDGNHYYEIPFWFKPMVEGWILYGAELPEDLKQFITKAGLGGENPQPTKVTL